MPQTTAPMAMVLAAFLACAPLAADNPADRLPVDDDGQVDLVDPPPPPAYRVDRSRRAVRIELPEYDVTLRSGPPFGISSLKLDHQPDDFAHSELPLADWEFFWYRPSGSAQLHRSKLLDKDWGQPEVRELEQLVEVRYRVPEPRTGVEMEVDYRFFAKGSTFQVIYTVRNGSSRALVAPYFMVGFPGFSNHAQVNEVGNARDLRLAQWPHRAFLQEARAAGKPEYQLLRQDAAQGRAHGLKGSVAFQQDGVTYRLSAYFLSAPDTPQLYAAHTNKPRYLTSHLYATLNDMPPGTRQSLTVVYVLSRE